MAQIIEPDKNNNAETSEQPPYSGYSATTIPEPNVRASRIKRIVPSRKKALLLLALLLLVGGGAFAYTKLNNQNNPPAANNQTSTPVQVIKEQLPLIENHRFADKFLPNFSDMRGYIDFDGEHWYAAAMSLIITKDKSYRQYAPQEIDGLTMFTDIAVADNTVWVGGQGGMGKYDTKTKTFKGYLKGEDNVELFVDPFDNTLYVGTFENFFAYDKASDSFKTPDETTIPTNIREMGFTKDYIVAVAPTHDENNSPIQVFNKKTKQWSVPKNLKYSKTDAQSPDVNLLTVDGKIIVYGRHVNYESCEQAGKYPATVVYQFNDNETFTELSKLTDLFSRNEANYYGYSETSLTGTSGCGENGSPKAFVVDMKVKDGTVIATNKRALENDAGGFGYYTHLNRVEQLEKEVGFTSEINLMHTLPNGSVFSLWNSPKQVSTAAIDADFKKFEKQTTKDFEYAITSYLECGGTKYHIVTSGKVEEMTPSFLDAIQKVEDGKVTTIYKAKNTPIYESVDAELTLANSEGACVDNNIVMLGKDVLAVFNPATKKLTQQPLGAKTSMELSVVNKSRTGFNFVDTKNFRLVRVGKDATKATSVKFNKEVLVSSEETTPKLLAFGDTHVVIARNLQDKDIGSRVYTVNAKDGKTIKSTDIDMRLGDGTMVDDNRFVVQFENGETKLLDTISHEGRVISKSMQGLNDTFAFVKDENSEFIVSEGYLWFTAKYWGLAGYKIP